MFFISLLFIFFLIKNIYIAKPWIWLTGSVLYLFIGLLVTHFFSQNREVSGSSFLQINKIFYIIILLLFAKMFGIFNYFYSYILIITEFYFILFLLRNVFIIKFSKIYTKINSIFYFFYFIFYIFFFILFNFFNLKFIKLTFRLLFNFFIFSYSYISLLSIYTVFYFCLFLFLLLFFKIANGGTVDFFFLFKSNVQIPLIFFFKNNYQNYLNFFDYFYFNGISLKSIFVKNQKDITTLEGSSLFLVNFNHTENLPIFTNFFNLNLTVNESFLKNKFILKKYNNFRLFSTKNKQSNPKNFFKNINLIFTNDFYFYKNNTSLVKKIKNNTNAPPITTIRNGMFLEVYNNPKILKSYMITLNKIRNLLLFKYSKTNFNAEVQDIYEHSYTDRNIGLLLNNSIFNNFDSKSYSKFLTFENLDYNNLSLRSNSLNYFYIKNNFLKSVKDIYSSTKRRIFNNRTFKDLIFIERLDNFIFKIYGIKNKNQLLLGVTNNWYGDTSNLYLNYKFKKYVKFTNTVLGSINYDVFTKFWYIKNVYYTKKAIENDFNFKKNYWFFLKKIVNQLRTFRIQNTPSGELNITYNKKLINFSNFFYKRIYKLENILYSNNIYSFSESVDKSQSSHYTYGVENLPWFEYSDSEDRVGDFSFILNLNDHIFDFEKLKMGIDTSTDDHWKKLKLDNKIFKKYNKINKLKKKYDTNFSSKRAKKNIWKMPIRWYFDINFEKFIRFNYKNTLTCFYEKKFKLKRTAALSSEFSPLSSKVRNNLGISNFTNTSLPLASEQIFEFGFINNDIFFEDKNMYNTVFISNTKDRFSVYSFFKKNIILPKILFSFKEHSNSSDNKIVNLKKFYSFYFNKNSNSVFDNFFQKKHYFFKIIKNNTVGGENRDYQTEKIDNFYIKDRKNLKINLDRFDYSLRAFWSPNLKNELSYKQDDNNFGEFFLNKRFLNTFNKKINSRSIFLSKNINRVDFFKLRDSFLLKFLNNNFRISLLNKNIKESKTIDFFFNDTVSIKNKEKPDLFYTQEDREISKNFVNKPSNQKPHTFYGFIWDEYLKQSYGFSLNFLDFNEQLKSKVKFNSLKYSDLSSKNNQKRIEDSSVTINNYVGMTKDSEIASIMLSKYLTSSGFVKEIHSFENLDEDFYKRKKHLFSDYDNPIKPYKKEKKKNKRKKKLKFKKYFKRELVRSTIYKSKLIKKSINLIKKYDEYPVGFKYNSIKNTVNFPYFKKFFKIINEDSYLKNNMYNKKNWTSNKNSDILVNNRSYLAKYSKVRKKKRKFILLFSGKKKKRKYRLSRNFYLNKYLDFSFLSFKNKNKKLIIFKDKYSDDFTNNQIKNKLKRNLKKIKPKNRLIRHRLKRIKNTSTILYKKNRNKKLKNFRLNEKFQNNLDIFLGGSLPIKNWKINTIYSGNYSDIYNIRENFRFGDYFRFYNNPILLELGSNFLFSKKLVNFDDKKYKTIFKQKYSINGNVTAFNRFLKKNQTDSTFIENTMMRSLYKTDSISKIYQKSDYSSPEYEGFYSNFLNLIDNSDSLEILVNFSDFKQNNDNHPFSLIDPVSLDYSYRNFEYSLYSNKISTLSGISDRYENSLLYNNYNLYSHEMGNLTNDYYKFSKKVFIDIGKFINYKRSFGGLSVWTTLVCKINNIKIVNYFTKNNFYFNIKVIDSAAFLKNKQITLPTKILKLDFKVLGLFYKWDTASTLFIFIKVYIVIFFCTLTLRFFRKKNAYFY